MTRTCFFQGQQVQKRDQHRSSWTVWTSLEVNRHFQTATFLKEAFGRTSKTTMKRQNQQKAKNVKRRKRLNPRCNGGGTMWLHSFKGSYQQQVEELRCRFHTQNTEISERTQRRTVKTFLINNERSTFWIPWVLWKLRGSCQIFEYLFDWSNSESLGRETILSSWPEIKEVFNNDQAKVVAPNGARTKRQKPRGTASIHNGLRECEIINLEYWKFGIDVKLCHYDLVWSVNPNLHDSFKNSTLDYRFSSTFLPQWQETVIYVRSSRREQRYPTWIEMPKMNRDQDSSEVLALTTVTNITKIMIYKLSETIARCLDPLLEEKDIDIKRTAFNRKQSWKISHSEEYNQSRTVKKLCVFYLFLTWRKRQRR